MSGATYPLNIDFLLVSFNCWESIPEQTDQLIEQNLAATSFVQIGNALYQSAKDNANSKL